MIESESLSRQQVADRYGICRNATYGWVDKGILPPPDLLAPSWGRGDHRRWSTPLLARWEEANAAILRRKGVYLDDLPPLNHGKDPGRTRSSRKGGRSKPRRESASASQTSVLSRYAQAIVLLTQATTTLAKAAASSRLLCRQELQKVLISLEDTRWRLRPPQRG